jgi:hypothetical protein
VKTCLLVVLSFLRLTLHSLRSTFRRSSIREWELALRLCQSSISLAKTQKSLRGRGSLTRTTADVRGLLNSEFFADLPWEQEAKIRTRKKAPDKGCPIWGSACGSRLWGRGSRVE